MDKRDQRSNVVILGMHRSGTSALAGSLNEMGWYSGLPSMLVEADAANEKGYFERLDVIAANEALLVDAYETSPLPGKEEFSGIGQLSGHAWILGAAALTDGSYSPGSRIRSRIDSACSALMAESDAANRPFAVKDPRLCLTSQFWREGLSPAKIVLIVRRPEEAARSLTKSNGLAHGINHLSWALYMLHALRATRANGGLIVLHEELMERPETVLAGVARHLGAPSDAAKATEFIERSLVHHRAGHGTTATPLDDIYLSIADGKLDHAGEKLEAIVSRESACDWRSIALGVSNSNLQSKARELEAQLQRINRHPVSGPLLRLLRWAKKDSAFGAGKEHSP